MNDEEKSKEQLIRELKEMQQLVAQLEASINQCQVLKDEMQKTEEMYRTIFENTGSSTSIIEEDTTISMVNAEHEKITGYSKEEVEGKMKWPQLFTPESVSKMLTYHQLRRISPNAAPRNYEAQLVDKNGNVKDVLMTVAMIPGTKKSLASIMDITEQKKAEKLLQQTQCKGENYEQEKQQAELQLRELLNNKVFLLSDKSAFLTIKTAPGYAHALALVIESMHFPEVLGTIAGNDLLLIITKEPDANATILNTLKANFN
ncbi:MAG: PAS domain S-box protein [Firmicutes bacterium]|nr:PAS domain S-box protein [Bacillota bacterium]